LRRKVKMIKENLSGSEGSQKKQMDAQIRTSVNKNVHSSYGTRKYLIVAVV
jgi:hypothetical protein